MRLERFRGLYVDLRAIPWTAKDRERARIKRAYLRVRFLYGPHSVTAYRP